MDKWVNGVGARIENKLKRVYDEAESVINVQMYNSARGEYIVQLSNGRCLVANLSNGTCSCQWWQIRGYPCKHVMAVVKKEKK